MLAPTLMTCTSPFRLDLRCRGCPSASPRYFVFFGRCLAIRANQAVPDNYVPGARFIMEPCHGRHCSDAARTRAAILLHDIEQQQRRGRGIVSWGCCVFQSEIISVLKADPNDARSSALQWRGIVSCHGVSPLCVIEVRSRLKWSIRVSPLIPRRYRC
jgi:hypothetical protein